MLTLFFKKLIIIICHLFLMIVKCNCFSRFLVKSSRKYDLWLIGTSLSENVLNIIILSLVFSMKLRCLASFITDEEKIVCSKKPFLFLH